MIARMCTPLFLWLFALQVARRELDLLRTQYVTPLMVMSIGVSCLIRLTSSDAGQSSLHLVVQVEREGR